MKTSLKLKIKAITRLTWHINTYPQALHLKWSRMHFLDWESDCLVSWGQSNYCLIKLSFLVLKIRFLQVLPWLQLAYNPNFTNFPTWPVKKGWFCSNNSSTEPFGNQLSIVAIVDTYVFTQQFAHQDPYKAINKNHYINQRKFF